MQAVESDISDPAFARDSVEPLKVELASISYTAWRDYREDYVDVHRFHDNSLIAGIVWCHSRIYAKELAARHDLDTIEDGRFFLVKLNPNTVVRWKKMNKERRTENVRTKRQDRIAEQQYDLFMKHVVHVVDVGWIPNATYTNFETILIVLKVGTYVKWEITLKETDGLQIVSDLTMGDLFRTPDTPSQQSSRVRRRQPDKTEDDKRKAAGDDE